METRVPSRSATRVLRIGGFDGFICFEAKGFSSGIWIFWHMDRLSLELLTLNDQVINLVILSGAKVELILTALYASPIEKFLRELWSYF